MEPELADSVGDSTPVAVDRGVVVSFVDSSTLDADGSMTLGIANCNGAFDGSQ